MYLLRWPKCSAIKIQMSIIIKWNMALDSGRYADTIKKKRANTPRVSVHLAVLNHLPSIIIMFVG